MCLPHQQLLAFFFFFINSDRRGNTNKLLLLFSRGPSLVFFGIKSYIFLFPCLSIHVVFVFLVGLWWPAESLRCDIDYSPFWQILPLHFLVHWHLHVSESRVPPFRHILIPQSVKQSHTEWRQLGGKNKLSKAHKLSEIKRKEKKKTVQTGISVKPRHRHFGSPPKHLLSKALLQRAACVLSIQFNSCWGMEERRERDRLNTHVWSAPGRSLQDL